LEAAGRQRTLIVGFGNVSRRDDGVGHYVVNALRRRLGLSTLAVDDSGMDKLGERVDSVLMHQLTVDFAEVIAQYDWVIFVDAHLGTDSRDLQVVRLEPCIKGGSVTLHHLPPGTLLALAQALYGKAPGATLVSIKGEDFDFGEGLSPRTQRWADEAADRIWESLMGEGADRA